jgi:hypothetical protein
MDPEDAIPYPQETTTDLYHEQDESRKYLHIQFL